MKKETTYTGFLWGGERMTAEHQPIATTLPYTDLNRVHNRLDVMLAASTNIREYATQLGDTLRSRGLAEQTIGGAMHADVTVLDWDATPNYWEIWDDNGNRITTSDD